MIIQITKSDYLFATKRFPRLCMIARALNRKARKGFRFSICPISGRQISIVVINHDTEVDSYLEYNPIMHRLAHEFDNERDGLIGRYLVGQKFEVPTELLPYLRKG